MDQFIEFSSNNTFLVASFFALLSYILFSEYRSFTQKFDVVTPVRAIQLINQSNSLLLDVRELGETKDGSIAGSKHVPLTSVKAKMADLLADKDKDIIVYCQTGHRSTSVCRQLTENGFEKVHSLKGGLVGWRDAQLPLVKK